MRVRLELKEVQRLMPRRDIADDLNFRIETVARALTRPHNRSAITLNGWRRVTVGAK
jgi:hypothetical protein